LKSGCPLCLSDEIKAYFGDIMKCHQCGLMFSIVKSFDPAILYNEEYFKGRAYRDYIKEEVTRTKLFWDKFNLIKKYLPQRGKILDVGCGAGFFLKLMAKMGYESYGVEISEYASSYAQKLLGLDVFRGHLIEAGFPDNFFDLITMWDVLEHLPNPLDVLTECRRIMRDGAVLVVETLNVDSVLVKILRRSWPLFAPPYHIIYYNTCTLTTLLERCGFKTMETIPMQTYVKTLYGFKPLRYFRYSILRKTIGKFLDDVILVVSRR